MLGLNTNIQLHIQILKLKCKYKSLKPALQRLLQTDCNISQKLNKLSE